MALQDGDVIEFDYELWVEGREALYDTTLKAAAESAGAVEPNAYYAPMAYVIGSGRIIQGLEKALRESEVGKTTTVDLPTAEAYGDRDPNLIETIPMAEFKKNDVEPQVGLELTYKNRRGVITTVGGGRVRIDFNPRLAGKALKYRFTVRKVARDDAEKVAGIFRMNFPAPVEWKATLGKSNGRPVATIEIPEQALFHPNWMQAKFRALADVRRFTSIPEVRVVEPYVLQRAAAEASTPA